MTGKDQRSRPHGSLTSGKDRRPTLVGLALALALAMAVPATASHLSEWKHDHSPQAIRHRPHGLAELVDRFGVHCSNKANDARTWFPSAVARHVGGYVKYHAKLARNVGYNIRTHIAADHRNPAIDYGVYGYRYSRGVMECPGGSARCICAGLGTGRKLPDTHVADVFLAVR